MFSSSCLLTVERLRNSSRSGDHFRARGFRGSSSRFGGEVLIWRHAPKIGHHQARSKANVSFSKARYIPLLSFPPQDSF